MDAREAFKLGFLSHCIEAGHTSPARVLGLFKQANIGAYLGLDALSNAVKGVGELGSTALELGLPVAALTPPLLGAGAGYLASKATDISDRNTDDAKNQEVMDEYHRQAERLRREGMLRRYADTGTRKPYAPML